MFTQQCAWETLVTPPWGWRHYTESSHWWLASKRRAYNSVRRSPSILSPKRRGTPYYTSPCAHTRARAYRHPSCRLVDPPSFDRHNLSLHTGKDALDKSTPCSTALPLIYALWRCARKGRSIARPLPRRGIRNQPSCARRTPDGKEREKKMSTFHFIRDPSGSGISDAIRSSYTKRTCSDK